MNIIRSVFLRPSDVVTDSRVIKEANCLAKNNSVVNILYWDRNKTSNDVKSNLKIGKYLVPITSICIASGYGTGYKKIFIPLIKLQFRMFFWLFHNRNNYDVIHACDLEVGFVGYIAARCLKKKFIYDIFDYCVDSKYAPKTLKKMIKTVDDYIINHADNAIICSEMRKEQIKGTNPKGLTIIHNTPPKSLIPIEYNTKIIKNDNIKIVYVGYLTEERLLRELISIILGNEKTELHIGGYGPLEQYISKIAMQNSRIHFYGKLSYPETLALESQCDIIPSIYDPTIRNCYFAASNKFYEALMLGKPLVVVKNTGMSDVVLNEDIGETINFNAKSLADAIQKLINRKNEWLVISERMKKIYDDKYSWDEMENRLINMYRNL